MGGLDYVLSRSRSEKGPRVDRDIPPQSCLDQWPSVAALAGQESERPGAWSRNRPRPDSEGATRALRKSYERVWQAWRPVALMMPKSDRGGGGPLKCEVPRCTLALKQASCDLQFSASALTDEGRTGSGPGHLDPVTLASALLTHQRPPLFGSVPMGKDRSIQTPASTATKLNTTEGRATDPPTAGTRPARGSRRATDR